MYYSFKINYKIFVFIDLLLYYINNLFISREFCYRLNHKSILKCCYRIKMVSNLVPYVWHLFMTIHSIRLYICTYIGLCMC